MLYNYLNTIILFLMLFFILYYLNIRSKILELHKETFFEYGIPKYRDKIFDIKPSPDCGPCRRCPPQEEQICPEIDMDLYMPITEKRKCDKINEKDWISNNVYNELNVLGTSIKGSLDSGKKYIRQSVIESKLAKDYAQSGITKSSSEKVYIDITVAKERVAKAETELSNAQTALEKIREKGNKLLNSICFTEDDYTKILSNIEDEYKNAKDNLDKAKLDLIKAEEYAARKEKEEEPVDCKLGDFKYGKCEPNSLRDQGQEIVTLPKNDGRACDGEKGFIDGIPVYDFKKVDCAPCPNHQKRVGSVCEDVVNCELGEIVFSNCNTDNTRNKGQIVKTNPKNDGRACDGEKGLIDGQTVYNFQEGVECPPCEKNQKRIQGKCREIINCELGQTINSGCKETNTRFTGQLARIIPENGGTECPTPTGEIKGQTVYNFQEVACEPCGSNEVRKRGVCIAKNDWKLFYKSVSGNVQKNESRDNSKNSAIIAVIDSNMLKEASNKRGERMDIWALGGGHGQPGLRFESRGYFMPKCRTDNRNIIGVFGSGTGNGRGWNDFRKEDRWGNKDIIYIHSGHKGVSHIMTADKTGRIHYNRRNIRSNDCPKEFDMRSNPNLTKFIKQFYIFQTNDKNKVFTFNDIPNSAKV